MQGNQVAALIGAFGSIQSQLVSRQIPNSRLHTNNLQQNTNELMLMMHFRQTALADVRVYRPVDVPETR